MPLLEHETSSGTVQAWPHESIPTQMQQLLPHLSASVHTKTTRMSAAVVQGPVSVQFTQPFDTASSMTSVLCCSYCQAPATRAQQHSSQELLALQTQEWLRHPHQQVSSCCNANPPSHTAVAATTSVDRSSCLARHNQHCYTP